MEFYSNDGILSTLDDCDYVRIPLNGRVDKNVHALVSREDLRWKRESP